MLHNIELLRVGTRLGGVAAVVQQLPRHQMNLAAQGHVHVQADVLVDDGGEAEGASRQARANQRSGASPLAVAAGLEPATTELTIRRSTN